jgi:putative DNA primase/helicase
MAKLGFTGTIDKYPPHWDGRLRGASGPAFFAQAIEEARLEGVPVPKGAIIADGKFHHYRRDPKDTKRSCRYVAHANGVPNIRILDMAVDGREPIFTRYGSAPDDMDAASLAIEAAANRAKHEAEDAARHANAAAEAERIWADARPADPNHGYLKGKGIKPHGIRQREDDLIIPVMQGDKLTGLQFIKPDGGKPYLKGTSKQGAYFLLGVPDGTIGICEGYATAAAVHEATGIAVVIAFDAGNLLPVAKAFEGFPGDVIICADDDCNQPGNPGLTKGREAAIATGARLAVPDFGPRRKANCTDFNDLARERGPEAVRECIGRAVCIETPKKENGKAADFISAVTPAESAESAESCRTRPCGSRNDRGAEALSTPAESAKSSDGWPELEPLFGSVARKPYPLDAFPAILRDAVEEVQGFNRTPMAMTATSALGVLSACAQHIADIERDKTLAGPISLWTLAFAASGERKSRLDNLFGAPIETFQARKAEELRPQIEARKREILAWKAKHEGYLEAIKREAKAGKTADKFIEQLNAMPAQPEPVRVPVILKGDDTTESLCYDLRFGWPSAALLESEAGAVFGSHAMSADKIMNALAVKNKLWDGGIYRIGRKTSESFTVEGARFTYGLQVQPDVIRQFQEKNGGLARGIGYWARFLMDEPESTQGTRLYREPPANTPKLSGLHARLSELLEIEPVFGKHGGLEPRRLKFSADGKRAWIEAHDAIEVRLGRGGDFYDVKDVASKAADNIARIASLFHILEHGPDGDVSAENVWRADVIMDYHLNEARRFFADIEASPAERDEAKLEEWLIAEARKQRTNTLSRSEAYKGAFSNRNRPCFEAAIKALVGLGRIRDERIGARKIIELRPGLAR